MNSASCAILAATGIASAFSSPGQPLPSHCSYAAPTLSRTVLVVCCDCNRPTLDTIKAAGFTLTLLERTALPKAPKFVRPAILGSATTPALIPSEPAVP